MAIVMLIPLFIAIPTPGSADREPHPDIVKLEAEFRPALRKWEEDFNEWWRAYQSASQPGYRAAMPVHPSDVFAPRAKEFIAKHAGKPEAMDGFQFILSSTNGFQSNEANSLDVWCAETLARDYASKPFVVEVLDRLEDCKMEATSRKLYEAIIKKNRNREAVATAMLSLGRMLCECASWNGSHPEKQAEGERLIRRVDAEFPGTYAGEEANQKVFELDHLQVGMVAPEIKGEDIDGKTIRLSQFRGKIVLLEFWGGWADSSGRLLPHPSDLTQEFAEKPFTVLGISSNPLGTTLADAISQYDITWPNIDDDRHKQQIRRAWNVRAIPQTYLIDHEGVIRYRNVFDSEQRSAIRKLLDAIPSDSRPPEGGH